jgi:hypothetical protein
MRIRKTPSVKELQIINRFEGLRRILVAPEFAQHREKPLAYWALPTDRRLPLVLLDRTLQELLSTPFAELAETPGIGEKKMSSLAMLLARAAKTAPQQLSLDISRIAASGNGSAGNSDRAEGNGSDPADITEAEWGQWRSSVVRHGLQHEVLGRLAPSLQNTTRVIWNTPLGFYTDYALAEIRGMKTHGEKRVRAILDVFRSLHALVSGMDTQEHLAVRVVPRLIDRVECWVGAALQTPGVPDEQQISDNFVGPLLDQIRLDATEQIVALAENRLGIHGPIGSVRQVARNMELTRARVYQLLNEINDIMTVRWPLGRHQAYQLQVKFERDAGAMREPPDLTQFRAAVELFYPDARRGAAGPLEQAPSVVEEFGELVGVE